MLTTIVARIARTQTAVNNCIESKNQEWEDKHRDALDRIMADAPSGAGFDAGTQLVTVSDKRIIFSTAFHHMDDMGGYDGWTEHKVTVRPLFDGVVITVSGKNRNEIKDHIAEVFNCWLTSESN